MKAHFENENMALNKLHNFELSEPENVTEVASNCNKAHTAGLDTIFIQIYMVAFPGVPGVSNKQIFFTNKAIAP